MSFVGVVTSPGFVAGLAILLLNDFMLKRAYGGVVTGKLSDFAGLWIFPAFFAALAPRRARAAVYIATALAFIWWKSPLAQSAINAWNRGATFDVGRVVDCTDLAALAVLPLSYAWFFGRSVGASPRRARAFAAPLAMLALFAFAATSSLPDVDRTESFVPEENTYGFATSKNVLIGKLEEIDERGRRYSEPATPLFSFTYHISVDTKACREESLATLTFEADFVDTGGDRSEVRLRKAFVWCDRDFTADELRAIFELEIIDELRRRVE